MFTLIGVLLIITGAVNPAGSQSLGININLIWGAVLLVFGALMLLGAFKGSKKGPDSK
jgi:hypothetical protein